MHALNTDRRSVLSLLSPSPHLTSPPPFSPTLQPLTANFLVNVVGALYKSMPLPPVPAPSAKWICHALVDKLKLHGERNIVCMVSVWDVQ